MGHHSTLFEHLDPTDRYLFQLFGTGLSAPVPFETVHAAFLHHANEQPDAVAIQDLASVPPRSLTYAELTKYASHLAKRLVDAGVQTDTQVPLVVRRSIEMVVGILGVLMAGGQYVPLDGGVVPDKTLEHVFRSCGADAVVLCTSSSKARVMTQGAACNVFVLEDVMGEALDRWNDLHLFQPRNITNGSCGCYVIYTSGTTGAPKGVDVTHANVTNLLCTAPGNVGMQPGMKVASILSVSFDMGAWETLGALANGCTLILRGSDWGAALRLVDVLISTPTILSGFNPSEFPNIKFVATAGEPLPQSTADRWANAGKVLFSGCGPTEVTIVNTMHIHTPGHPVSIGRPTPNNTVYILDEEQKPVSIGKPGILWAGGAGISRGYVNLPEKTAERWRPDPFAADGSLMFNTGDLGYWLANGTLQIIGRVDDQVKIKGFRVELDGVSATLASCPGVLSAVCLMVNDKLCAFVTPKDCNLEEALEAAKSQQPYYAVPSFCHALDEFPKTPNGKIDKAALREVAQEVHFAMSSGRTSNETAVHSRPFSTNGSRILSTDLSEKTLEAGVAEYDSNNLSLETLEQKKPPQEYPLRDKIAGKYIRGLRHRIFIVYRTLFSFIWLFNIILIILIALARLDTSWLCRVSYMNLTLAVIVRQDHIVNLIYKVVCSVPPSWPLWIRRRAAKVYHFGGIHTGAASASVAWYVAALVFKTWGRITYPFPLNQQTSIESLVVSYLTLSLLFVIVGTSWPSFRKAHHDLWERVHRFVGWTALSLVWIGTMLAINDGRQYMLLTLGSSPSIGRIALVSPEFWLVVATTISVALSWVTLRKVPVDSEVLSPHAVRLHFGYAVPVNGSFTRLSVRPLIEWHSFATIAAPDKDSEHGRGYSLVVSNAGDWTKDVINNPRSKIWVRGVPTCGVMRIATLFNRLVLVGTGSGIGPLLGFVERPTCPFRLVWSTKSPDQTYGSKLCDLIRRSAPDAVIHDTKVDGRPDLVKMTWREVQAFGAEAVIVIANEKLTRKVVYGMETRGIPAFGAIWDS